ncbi:uncharacterized protein LOC123873131 [Maniola jurtina]|uniref:uncharacterized protein LOC123873131 n=1 Tax=Maniola jurtina TaxID=191418 RepID=UPI001E68C2E5|nr:uncharacterized protein LOC123873131 [Maniola jurtina]
MATKQRPCIICHRSTNRIGGRPIRRSSLLNNDFLSRNCFVLDYIQNADHSVKVVEQDRICRPCFQRAEHWHRRRFLSQESYKIVTVAVQQHVSESDDAQGDQDATAEVKQYVREFNESQDTTLEIKQHVSEYYDTQDKQEATVKVKKRVSESDEAQDMTLESNQYVSESDDAQDTTVLRHSNVRDQGIQTGLVTIEIPGYSRVPNSSRRCIIKGCNNINLHRVNNVIRMNMLLDKNLYIPSGVRVCEEHIQINVWGVIENFTRNTFSTFNKTQITGMLALQKRALSLSKRNKKKKERRKTSEK